MSKESALPCHVIAGPLGVGKTTAILDYLRRHAGQQQVGVLVNDFGPVGLDGAILEGDPSGDGLRITTVPGGCVCCAAAEGLVTSIQRLLEVPGLDRLIIEPSGMADPEQVLGLLRQMAGTTRLELRPTIALLDATEFEPQRASQMPFFRHMADAADILVLNRCDAADAATTQAFRDWAEALEPAKMRVVTTEHGHLDDALFALRLPEGSGPEAPGHEGTHEHAHGEADGESDRTGGATWPPERQFHHGRLTAALAELAEAGVKEGEVERFKGIFHTDRGWFVLQIAGGRFTLRETPPRRDSRADWIVSDGDPRRVRQALEDTLAGE
ncbi:CobW family GTP-binding protein [Thiohalorhabdus sp. Cl-TMA]|uniref:GTP-binding protein n=1 Tax=Thiohalorhabdus methylotrophus TaxID=3242694 RepID=A0ABV4TR34_9GAMM